MGQQMHHNYYLNKLTRSMKRQDRPSDNKAKTKSPTKNTSSILPANLFTTDNRKTNQSLPLNTVMRICTKRWDREMTQKNSMNISLRSSSLSIVKSLKPITTIISWLIRVRRMHFGKMIRQVKSFTLIKCFRCLWIRQDIKELIWWTWIDHYTLQKISRILKE